jgi:hypothetical protein
MDNPEINIHFGTSQHQQLTQLKIKPYKNKSPIK